MTTTHVLLIAVASAVAWATAAVAGAAAAPAGQAAGGKLVTYDAPAGEKASEDYKVTVNGRPVFVYTVATLRGGPASFAYFDFAGPAAVEVASTRQVSAAKCLPTSWGLTPAVDNNKISFQLRQPRNVTLEINGGFDRPLHLFANPIEADAPAKGDPNVVYLGPGVHDLPPTRLKSGQTLYLAGGAVVRPRLQPDEKPTVQKNWAGNKTYVNLVEAKNAKGVRIRGRGVLDMSLLPWHARTAFVLSNCTDVLVEGVIVLDAPAWVVAMFGCKDVTVRNVKQICRRENSDGVDVCNSQDVLVEDCFLRNNDDEVCVKTTSPAPAQESKNIVVRRCVVWNERARGLGITSETRRDISNVLFQDCDIIHDFAAGGDCGALAILVSDSGTMSNVRFEDIRVEDCRSALINCWIGADMWGHDKQRGHVKGVLFKNITAAGKAPPASRLTGCDATHLIEDVTFENLRINGRVVTALEDGRITVNQFVKDVKFRND
jgi:hypothetical protein